MNEKKYTIELTEEQFDQMSDVTWKAYIFASRQLAKAKVKEANDLVELYEKEASTWYDLWDFLLHTRALQNSIEDCQIGGETEMKTEVRKWYEHLSKNTSASFWDKENHIALSYNGNGEHLIRVHPCGFGVKLHSNGAKFAYRAALRAAKKLHMVTDENANNDFFHVRITTNKDVKRLEELWKYLTGRTFNKRILNNGWWG